MAAAAHTPFEARTAIFVLERADTMNDEAANALLKTLEEPPSYVVLLLLTDSRRRCCRRSPAAASPCASTRRRPASSRTRCSPRASRRRPREAAARLSLGDGEKALALALGDGPGSGTPPRRSPARRSTATAASALAGGPRPRAPAGRGGQGGGRAALKEELQYLPKKEHKRRETEFTERARRADRRAATQALDHALQLTGLWYRDLAVPRRGRARAGRSTPTAPAALQAGRRPRPRRCSAPRSSSTTRAPR